MEASVGETPSPSPEERARDLAASLFDGTILTEKRLASDIADAIREAEAAARADERERCARVANGKRIPEKAVSNEWQLGYNRACEDIAAAIRALPDPTTPAGRRAPNGEPK
jgi:hypothetical protein